MKVTDVIRKAENDHVIYFLLNSYIGVARDCDKLKSLPAQIAKLPLANKADLRFRFEILMCELDTASKRLDDEKCIIIKEALTILGTALYRLQSLGSQQSPRSNFSNPAGKKPSLSGGIIGMHAP